MSNFTYDNQTFNYPVDIEDKKEYIKLFIEFYDFTNKNERSKNFSLKDKEFMSRFYAVNALNRSN
jgi:hypothetical protein